MLINEGIIDNISAAVLICDIKGNVVFRNKQFRQLFSDNLSHIKELNTLFYLSDSNTEIQEKINQFWANDMKLLLEDRISPPLKTYKMADKSGRIKEAEITYKHTNDHIIVTIIDRNNQEISQDLANEKLFSDKLIDSMHGVLFISSFDKNFPLIRWNENLEKVSGYSTEELRGMNLKDFFSDTDYSEIYILINEIRHNRNKELKTHIKTKTNELIPYYLGLFEFNYDRKCCFVAIGLDISEQVKFQNYLKESEERYRTIIDNFPDIILIFDYDGNLLYTNSSLEKQTGLRFEDIKMIYKNTFIHPEDAPNLQKDIRNFISSDRKVTRIVENRIYDKNGQIHWMRGFMIKIKYNGKPALQTVSRDITEKKRAEAVLKANEEQLNTTFESTPMIMMLVTKEGKVTRINRKGRESMRKELRDKGELRIGNVLNCVRALRASRGCGSTAECKNCKIRNLIEDTFYNGRAYFKEEISELHLALKAERKYYLISTSILKNTEPETLLLTVDDITERKVMEKDLKLAKEKAEESDRLKSAFLQNISHEVRTPMNAIIGFSDLILAPNISKDDLTLYIKILSESAKQLLTVVDNILDISQIESGDVKIFMEDFEPRRLLRDMASQFKTRVEIKNIDLVVTNQGNNVGIKIRSDFIKLQKVFTALIENAIKFTKKGTVELGYRLIDNAVEFWVSDTGIGIPPEIGNSIFEPFRQADMDSTRNYGGTGLGLTIAKSNIELLGGKIWFNSIPDKGTKFYFTVPYIKEETSVDKSEIITTLPEIDHTAPTILIAEDDETNFLLLEEILKSRGINILLATDGIQAVDIAQQQFLHIDLILMDIKMPKMNGMEAVKRIRTFNTKIPIVALTAYTTISDRNAVFDAGVNEYLTKPVKIDQLMTVLTKYNILQKV